MTVTPATRRVNRGRGQTTCSIHGCGKPSRYRGRCGRHYREWLAMRPLLCGVDGCDRPRYARGFCVMHYTRLRATGQLGAPTPKIAAAGTGHVTGFGYRTIRRPDHPLGAGRAQHRVEEHRIVLYDAIGPGRHDCHWCGRSLDWFGTPGDSLLVVDHLDENRLNNQPRNLVPSCLSCNTGR